MHLRYPNCFDGFATFSSNRADVCNLERQYCIAVSTYSGIIEPENADQRLLLLKSKGGARAWDYLKIDLKMVRIYPTGWSASGALMIPEAIGPSIFPAVITMGD